MPHCFKPISSVLRARPAAISTTADSILFAAPPASTSSVTLSAPAVPCFTVAPVMTSMPRFL